MYVPATGSHVEHRCCSVCSGSGPLWTDLQSQPFQLPLLRCCTQKLSSNSSIQLLFSVDPSSQAAATSLSVLQPRQHPGTTFRWALQGFVFTKTNLGRPGMSTGVGQERISSRGSNLNGKVSEGWWLIIIIISSSSSSSIIISSIIRIVVVVVSGGPMWSATSATCFGLGRSRDNRSYCCCNCSCSCS